MSKTHSTHRVLFATTLTILIIAGTAAASPIGSFFNAVEEFLGLSTPTATATIQSTAPEYELGIGTASIEMEQPQPFAPLADIATEGFENAFTLFAATGTNGTFVSGNTTASDRPASSPKAAA